MPHCFKPLDAGQVDISKDGPANPSITEICILQDCTSKDSGVDVCTVELSLT